MVSIRGLKENSAMIQISAGITEGAPGTFTSKRVDLQLNPLDREVFVVQAIDMNANFPGVVPGTKTETKFSVSTTARTSVGSIAEPNVMAFKDIIVSEDVALQSSAGETPATALEYISIIATNDFHLNVQGGGGNLGTVGGEVRLYGFRAVADATIYSALVQSELLS